VSRGCSVDSVTARFATVFRGGLIAIALVGGCAHHPLRAAKTLPSHVAVVKHDSVMTGQQKTVADSAVASAAQQKLSPASELVVKACDNYLSVNPDNPKGADVLTIKASLYYNNRLYEQSRESYRALFIKYPNTPAAAEAVRMIGQGFYEEKNFDSAQAWYRKLSTMNGEGVNKGEALERIAESIFRKAEEYEKSLHFKEAADQYQRISMEFPDTKIADVALFNAGLCFEKQTEWSHEVLTMQQLVQRYVASPLIPKAMFRIGKAYEKLQKWELAADSYLRMVAKSPTSELAPTALYNAGFSFENADKLPEAAATFEKMVLLYPKADDAADILFRSGELYGKLKNWEAVTRVNQLFSQRFGNDANRVVQALCMAGIALYMQNKEAEAVVQLMNTVAAFSKIKNPSAGNAYYAAKAQYTIGEIQQGRMNKIALTLPRTEYQKQLAEKSDLLDQTVGAYSHVISFAISEWTTRAICQIGQAYEEFAVGIFKQERPQNISVAERLALELGIAQAVENYFIDKALKYHEQNVKLGIKEKLDDKYITLSRQKLTYLPYIAGENYLALTGIANAAESDQKLEGFALIGHKLELLQKIAPFQERATDLFLKCLEVGSTYQQTDDFYKKASSSITGISCTVAQTYADVVTIVLEAPIPPNFDKYERFVYKTKLLKQVEGYQNQAMTSYLKTLKIATAYVIADSSVQKAREGLAQLLYVSGRSKDLLCIEAFGSPPYPHDISEAEKEEYRARFEEIGLRFQEQAFEIYKSIINFAAQKYAAGPFVQHAYVRLYQNFPEEYGVAEERLYDSAITSGPEWKCSADSAPGWSAPAFSDSAWPSAAMAKNVPATIAGFPSKTPSPLCIAAVDSQGAAENQSGEKRTFFRRSFIISDTPHNALFYLFTTGSSSVFINGNQLPVDSGTLLAKVVVWNVTDKLRKSKNLVAITVSAPIPDVGAVYPLIELKLTRKIYNARPPGAEGNLAPDQVRPDVYRFPPIKNFTLETGTVNK
jgi:TolA-binding protein